MSTNNREKANEIARTIIMPGVAGSIGSYAAIHHLWLMLSATIILAINALLMIF